MKKTLKQHEQEYIHIRKPSWKGIGKFFLAIFLGFLSYFNFKLILKLFQDYNLGYVFADKSELINYSPKFIDLIVLYPIIGEFILLSSVVICSISLFKKLKSYKEKGALYFLVFGFIASLIIGLICGLIIGLKYNLIYSLITYSISGFITSLVFGLIKEFK